MKTFSVKLSAIVEYDNYDRDQVLMAVGRNLANIFNRRGASPESVKINEESIEVTEMLPYTLVGFYKDTGQSWVNHVISDDPADLRNHAPEGVKVVAALPGHLQDLLP